MAEKEYIRLPGKSASLYLRSAAWMGKDHLLRVDTSGYTEQYRRFYYRDIQAVILRKTPLGAIVNVVLGGLTLMFLGMAAVVNDAVGSGVLGFIAGLFFFFLMVNVILGATCTCHLQTAVQTQELPSLSRLRAARKALKKLKPVIEEAQGRLEPGVVEAKIAELVQTPPTIQPAYQPRAAAPVASPPPLIVHYHGGFHLILFIMLLVDALLALTDLAFPFKAHQAINAILTVAELGCLIGALIRQHNSDMPRSLRWLAWGLLWAMCGLMMMGFFYGIVIAAGGRSADLNAQQDAGIKVLTFISVLVSLGIAIPGLFLLLRFRRESQPPPIPPVIDGTGN